MKFLRRGNRGDEISISTRIESTTDVPELLARLKTNGALRAKLAVSFPAASCLQSNATAPAPSLDAGEVTFRALRKAKEVELVVLPPNPEEKHGKLQMVVVEDHHVTLEHITALLKQVAHGILKPEQVTIVYDI